MSSKKNRNMSTYFSNYSLQCNDDLRGIFEGFIAPFVKFFLDRQTLEKHADIIYLFFHGDDRKILTARCKKQFKMPGRYKLCALKHINGIIAWVKPGDRLYIRLDRTTPNEIDVELVAEKTTVYRLTNKQFRRILSKLEIESGG